MNEKQPWEIQGSPEWLSFRKNKIGASEAGIIMGVSPWMTPNKLWQSKMGLYEQPENEAMRRGKDLEDLVRTMFSRKKRIEFKPKVMLNSQFHFMMASLDGINDFGEIIEIKCPGKEDHELAKKGIVPSKYIYQLQHIMECCNITRIEYISYYKPTGDLVHFNVDRNDDLIKRMLVEEQKFYDCMVNFIEPPLSEGDFFYRDDEEWKRTVSAYKLAKNQLKTIQDEESRLRQELISMTNGTATHGNGLRLSQHMRRGQIDYSTIPELVDIDLESHRRPASQVWRINDE